MRLRSIRLFQFRNVSEATVLCDAPRVFFEGLNGQGKTNLLEAASFLQSLRSFRIADRSALIQNGHSEGAIQSIWEHDDQGETHVSVVLEKRSRRVAIDGQAVNRLSDFIGQFPSVMMASQDIQLIRGGPGERRRFLDMVLAGTDLKYLALYQRFQKTLLERNQLLKRGRSDAELAAFDKIWVPTCWELSRYRSEAIERFNKVVAEVYTDIADGQEVPSLEYQPSVRLESEEAWRDIVEKSKVRDRLLGTTQKGPHRDELRILLDGHLAASHASEGQQRGLVLALRFAELRWVHEQLGRLPVLLADDILSELDPTRRQRFWALIENWRDLQILATGTSFPSSERLADWKRFEVHDGSYQPSS